jgi:hypothetical protein
MIATRGHFGQEQFWAQILSLKWALSALANPFHLVLIVFLASFIARGKSVLCLFPNPLFWSRQGRTDSTQRKLPMESLFFGGPWS